MKMEMTVLNFKWHVSMLSKAFDIAVIYDPRLNRDVAAAVLLNEERFTLIHKAMGLQRRAVCVPPIDDVTSYTVVMHEMGHHLAPNGFCMMPQPAPGSHPRVTFEWLAAKLVAEEAAWEWARYYIEQVFDWTTAMEQTKQYSLQTYVDGRRRGR